MTWVVSRSAWPPRPRRSDRLACSWTAWIRRASHSKTSTFAPHRLSRFTCRCIRQVKRDKRCGANVLVFEWLARRIHAVHEHASLSERRGRGGQAERLTTQVILRNQESPHDFIVPRYPC